MSHQYSYVSLDVDLSRNPGYLLRRIQRLGCNQAEGCFVDQELTFSQWLALRLIMGGIADTAGSLARNMGHDTGAVTRLVDQLEKRHLLTRERQTNDRRVVTLVLTDAGKKAVALLTPRLNDMWVELFSGFSPDEVDTLITLLHRLLLKLEAREEASVSGVPV